MRRYVYPIGCLSHTSSFFIFRRRVLAVLAPPSVYVLLLSYVSLPGVLLSDESRTFTLVTARYNVLSTVIGQTFRLRVHHDGAGIHPSQLWQEQARRFSPSGSTHFNNPAKSRNIPTQVEVDRVEQSLILIRADLASKGEELNSLEMREASHQSEVVYSESDCHASPDLGS